MADQELKKDTKKEYKVSSKSKSRSKKKVEHISKKKTIIITSIFFLGIVAITLSVVLPTVLIKKHSFTFSKENQKILELSSFIRSKIVGVTEEEKIESFNSLVLDSEDLVLNKIVSETILFKKDDISVPFIDVVDSWSIKKDTPVIGKDLSAVLTFNIKNGYDFNEESLKIILTIK